MSDDARSGPEPTISRRLEDGRMVELVYDPERRETALAIGGAGLETRIEAGLTLQTGQRLQPYSAQNNLIASGCVLFASGVAPYGDKATLLDAVQTFLRRYVDLSPAFERIAAHYVLLTWVHDAFAELPYLRFRGDYGTGKTRALLAIGALCYKPFFASGASTVSPIFHVLDAFGATLVLDEADFRFSDATAPLTKILNNGHMAGLPVLRTMTNRHKELNPRAFKVFGPKLVGMRHSFSDRALESRFLTEETGLRPLRPDIPIQLPAALHEEARALRNQLLAWRFAALDEQEPDPSRAAPGVEPRLNQTALSLLSVMDDPEARAEVHAALAREQDRLQEDRAATYEGLMTAVLSRLFAAPAPGRITVAAVADAFSAEAGDRLRQPATPKWTGWFLRERLKLATAKSGGVFIVPETERPRILALAARFGTAAAPDA